VTLPAADASAGAPATTLCSLSFSKL
jgi:hypothetical protein